MGTAAIVSPSCRIRYPQVFRVADDSIVDDFCYFSTAVEIGRCVHVAAGCVVAGGSERVFVMDDFSGLASGVKIYCASDDFVHDLSGISPQGMESPRTHHIVGDVRLHEYAVVGANAVVMPGNDLPEGVAVGALSFVPPRFAFEPWTVYAGNPIRKVIPRDRRAVLHQARKIREFLDRS